MSLRWVAAALLTFALAIPGLSQTRRLTTDDYARAEKFMGYNTNPLVLHAPARPVWLADDRFWYRVAMEGGTEFILIDPVHGTRGPAGDQAKVPADRNTVANRVVSPDGKRAVFIRNFNLWMADIASGNEVQLTTDGVKDFGYATDNAGWTRSDRPIVVWSPDSKKIATFQQDQRNVGEMYLVDTRVGHPSLQAWKYPLPGDDVVTMVQRVIVDVSAPEAAKVVRLQMP